jgi:hypothetical protein
VLIRGRCHCHNVTFSLLWEPSPAEIQARACTCTFCTKHGGVWASHPPGILKVFIQKSNAVSKYSFGTHTADFYVCSKCGCVPVVSSTIEGRKYAVVNVNTFEDKLSARVRQVPVTHAEEDQAARLARRAKNWIGNVEVVNGGT